MLGSAELKKHMGEIGMAKEVAPVPAPVIPTTNLEIPVAPAPPILAAEDLSKNRVTAPNKLATLDKASRFSLDAKPI